MLHQAGMGVHEIGRRLGRSASTISRELRRNRAPHDVAYDPGLGHGGGDALTARVHDRDADAFVNPQVLLVDAQHTDDQDLADLRRHIDSLTATPGARCATAVVITGQTGELSAQTPIRLGPGRSIRVGPMGSMWQDVPLTASQLTDTEIEVLVQRLALADQPDEPAAAAVAPPANLRKTAKLIGVECARMCQERNISTCWSDHPGRRGDPAALEVTRAARRGFAGTWE